MILIINENKKYESNTNARSNSNNKTLKNKSKNCVSIDEYKKFVLY